MAAIDDQKILLCNFLHDAGGRARLVPDYPKPGVVCFRNRKQSWIEQRL
jgi:hypothetical protein